MKIQLITDFNNPDFSLLEIRNGLKELDLYAFYQGEHVATAFVLDDTHNIYWGGPIEYKHQQLVAYLDVLEDDHTVVTAHTESFEIK